MGQATLLLAAAAGGTALLSDFLVASLQPAVNALGLSKPFVGLILVPVVGNAAEHAGAIRLAMRDQMDVSIEIAVGSSTQIALFVAPFLVFFSLVVGKPLDFFFSGFEIAAVGFSTAIVALISRDGRSDWLEGGAAPGCLRDHRPLLLLRPGLKWLGCQPPMKSGKRSRS